MIAGDMAAARAPGRYTLVYLVYNAISALLTQSEQVACFRNAARHLLPGGRFVIELWVPELRKLPPGQQATLRSRITLTMACKARRGRWNGPRAAETRPGVETAGGSCRSLVSRVIRLRLEGRPVTLGGWLRWRCGMTRRCHRGRNCGGGCGMIPASGRY